MKAWVLCLNHNTMHVFAWCMWLTRLALDCPTKSHPGSVRNNVMWWTVIVMRSHSFSLLLQLIVFLLLIFFQKTIHLCCSIFHERPLDSLLMCCTTLVWDQIALLQIPHNHIAPLHLLVTNWVLSTLWTTHKKTFREVIDEYYLITSDDPPNIVSSSSPSLPPSQCPISSLPVLHTSTT